MHLEDWNSGTVREKIYVAGPMRTGTTSVRETMVNTAKHIAMFTEIGTNVARNIRTLIALHSLHWDN